VVNNSKVASRKTVSSFWPTLYSTVKFWL